MHQVCLNPNLDLIFTPPFQEAIKLNIFCFISDRIWKYKSGLVVLIIINNDISIFMYYTWQITSTFFSTNNKVIWNVFFIVIQKMHQKNCLNLSCPFHAILDNYLQLLLDMFWTSCMQKVLISSSGELWNIRYKQVIRRFTSCSNQVA